MSSLWTPRGEHTVPPDAPAQDTQAGTAGPVEGSPPDASPPDATVHDEEMAQRLRELQDQLVAVPAEQVVSQHMMGMAELAALHLRQDPPALDEAQLAIDAVGMLVEGLGERLSQHEAFTTMLSEIRMVFVAAKQRADQPSAAKQPADQ